MKIGAINTSNNNSNNNNATSDHFGFFFEYNVFQISDNLVTPLPDPILNYIFHLYSIFRAFVRGL